MNKVKRASHSENINKTSDRKKKISSNEIRNQKSVKARIEHDFSVKRVYESRSCREKVFI